MKIRAILLLLLLLCGCVSPAVPPVVAVPEQWQAMQTEPTFSLTDACWWQQFDLPELSRLIVLANARNQDWQAALSRIAQARSALQRAGAVALPQLSGHVSAAVNQSKIEQDTTTTHNQNVGATLSYEIDIWGRLRANKQAASEQVRASEYDAMGVRLMLETAVASTYFQLCALNERVSIAEDTVALGQETLDRMEKMQLLGAVTAIDLSQQKQWVANTRASIEMLKAQFSTTRSALAVLVGMAPQDFQVKIISLNRLQYPIPQATQPATLLTRRVDILRAEAYLLAAAANVMAARAAFFPAVTLSASSVLSGWASGGTALVSALTAGLTAPLFDGGQHRADLSSATARQEELSAIYRQTVLQALKEAEDALQNLQHSQQRRKNYASALSAAQTAYQLSQAQYQLGEINYLTLLETQRTWLSSQDNMIQVQNEVLGNIIMLYKALGGSASTL